MNSTYTIEEIATAMHQADEVIKKFRAKNISLSKFVMKLHMRLMYLTECYDIKTKWHRKLWMNAGWELIDLLEEIKGP